jgi:hypothetical protein
MVLQVTLDEGKVKVVVWSGAAFGMTFVMVLSV